MSRQRIGIGVGLRKERCSAGGVLIATSSCEPQSVREWRTLSLGARNDVIETVAAVRA
jgi:hypothetical protein